MCVGGPALIIYVTPTEEELFKVRCNLCPFRTAVAVCIEASGSGTIQSCRNDH